jgi:hypothetical protein
MTNPGPATTITPSQVATLTNQNALGPTVPGQASNALRLIAVGRAISINGTGDAAIMPIINASSWVPVTIVFSNALIAGVSGNIAAGTVSVQTAAAAGGTVIRTSGVLTGMTTSAVALVNPAAAAAAALNFQGANLFLNVTVAVANGTVDCFVYGYDVS